MNIPSRIRSLGLLWLFVLAGCTAMAANEEEVWGPTPPRLSFIDGEVSYWRPGTEEWVGASANLPLAEGDSLYAGKDANFEVQFGPRSFVRADEDSQLALLEQDEGRIQFKVTSGLISLDMRRIAAGSRVEVSTPNAVFIIEDPGYYRVEVESRDTHFITRHGGEATLTTADGRTLSIFPSEDIVVTAGTPVKVATYAAPPPDAWDRWNDARSERSGESVSARYLPPGVYGAEELDHYGHWRVVATYGAVWIPAGVSVTWVPYSSGYWVWDPYYEWSWVSYEPWGWAPFHYGRWVYIDGYWAWAPGPIVRRPVYAPALVGFMVVGSGVSVSIGVGLPGVWWVPLGWGEPLVPWWHRHRYRGHPRWDGWGGPRVVNGRELRDRPFTNVAEIRYHNAELPRRAIVTVPPDKFGRERQQATVETRYHARDFAPLRGGDVPIKPSRASPYGGASKGVQPPREVISRPVVSTRPPRQPAAQPWQAPPSRVAEPKQPQPGYVIPPTPRSTEPRSLQRPPFGADGGPEVTPPPRPPRYGEVRAAPPPVFTREEATTRKRVIEQRREPFGRPPVPRRGEVREERRERALPGQPANLPHKRREREND